MKKALRTIFAAIATLFATPVWAANMPVKAPPAPVPPAPVYDWSGFYGGIGAGWSRTNLNWAFTNPTPAISGAPFSASVTDAIGGPITGVQFEFYHIVIGVDATLNSFFNEDNKFATVGFPSCLRLAAFPNARCQVGGGNSTWTAGGRAGLALDGLLTGVPWTGSVLIYGEGGWAHTDFEARLSTLANPVFDDASIGARGTYWGVGFDYMAWTMPHFALILGLEYQRINFGTQTITSALDTPAFSPCPPGNFCRNISATEDIFRIRLTGKWNPFEYAAAPAVMTKY